MAATTLQGTGILPGQGRGPAMVTRQPFNFTAALTKLQNLVRTDQVQDRHHEWFRRPLRGRVLVIPAAVGSTHSGLVILELLFKRVAPAAIVVQAADSLLVSGVVLGDVWFERGLPVVEYPGDDLYTVITEGADVAVDGTSGEIQVG